MVVGALLLSSPLLAMLAITYDPGTRVSASDGEDTATLARAARYDARLLRDGGSIVTFCRRLRRTAGEQQNSRQ